MSEHEARATDQHGPLLVVDGLTVRFGPRAVVDDVSFTIGEGQRLAIIGESGSGKTLTALALIGLTPETAAVSGSVRFAGAELIGRRERDVKVLRGEQIAMVFQNPQTALNPLMRVGRQVAEPLRRHHGLSKRAAGEAALALCDRVGLPDPERSARAYPHQLSGGQRQRVGIAMALACRPALLIADEPTTALDVTVQAGVLALLAELIDEERTALLFITHDVALVPKVADRVVVMREGAIVEHGSAASVIEEPQHPYTVELLDAARRTALPPDDHLDAEVLT
jgi:ABC-type microcin C transport system duplicated ATPase subunit YejF